MSLKDELLFIAEMFNGNDKKYIERAAYCGDEEKMSAVIYEAQEKLSNNA